MRLSQAIRPAGRRPVTLWGGVVACLLAVALAPLLVIAAIAIVPESLSGPILPGVLLSPVLPEAARTTVLLMAGVGAYVTLAGVATAWLVSMCRFPGRDFLQWALILPLSIPTYIVAYAHVEMLDYTGPLQTGLRALFGWTSARQYWFPSTRSLPSAIFVMGAVLYPYVYLSARSMFQSQSAATIEAARTLGCGASGVFFRVALPLARPAIMVGVTLALMETLNDIGAVEYLGVRTLTFSIYETWLNRGDLKGATQLACLMLIVVALMMQIERHGRRRHRFNAPHARSHRASGYELTGWRAGLALAVCATPVVLGFVMPVAVLARYAVNRREVYLDPVLQHAALNTALLAGLAAVATVGLGLILAFAARIGLRGMAGRIGRLVAVGYAIPGTVLALGTLIAAAWADNRINDLAQWLTGHGAGLVLISSGLALVYAYAVRYLSVAFGTLEAGLTRIGASIDMAARTLGATAGSALRDIHLPLLQPSMLTAALLVFVEVTKELPATLLLRPFGLETLATYVYVQASREAVGDAAPAALMIIAVGIVPLIVLSRLSERLPHLRLRRRVRPPMVPLAVD